MALLHTGNEVITITSSARALLLLRVHVNKCPMEKILNIMLIDFK
jgi:hypothetical protein